MTHYGMKLTDGAQLSVGWYESGYHSYCRTNSDADMTWCYGFKSDAYFHKTWDTLAKEWVVTWNERDGNTTPKPTSSKPTTDDIEM